MRHTAAAAAAAAVLEVTEGGHQAVLEVTQGGHQAVLEVTQGGYQALLEPEDPRLWHPDYVKMPFSQKAQCTVPGRIWPSLETKSKWEVIHEALTKPIVDFIGLKEAILSYNEKNKDLWEFGGLKFFLDEELDDGERTEFFDRVLPEMAKLALNLPQFCSQPIPLLKTGTAHSITMSQEQAACLLANAFFCTFQECNTHQKQFNFPRCNTQPRRPNVPGCNTQPRRSNIPGINFNRLYRGRISQKRVGKLKCLLHYFKTVTENMPQGNLTYSRQVLKHHEFPKWEKCQNVFPQLHVSSGGTIEDDGCGMLQVDFANKYIGGGVLREGSVQEEIRFVICPELIVSLLFTEVLDPNEAVVITGPQRFSNYKGYANSFQWGGDYKDPTLRDSWGRCCTQVVAIDAVKVKSALNQFEAKQVCRELNKAYVGFYDPDAKLIRTAVATGNWGCGAFGGDLRLKVYPITFSATALIQLMAAAAAGRDVCYFTYKDNSLTQDIYNIHKLITDRGLTVGDVWRLICDYSTSPYYSVGDSRCRSAQSSARNRGANNNHNVAASGARDRKKDIFEFIQETE
ncbi:Poly(ADP-ribose) glycohydrolase [Lamellibrachia satsuma]|nr:Poly(ADP-ribose) glycohydrolase [Lamellibrachia satsuma]